MNDREIELRQKALRLFLGIRLIDAERATGVRGARISDAERGISQLNPAEQRLVTNFLKARLGAVLGEENAMDHDTRRLADTLCALYADASPESDKKFKDVSDSLTVHELHAVREELARRVLYHRAHPERQSLLDFPAFLEKVLSRT